MKYRFLIPSLCIVGLAACSNSGEVLYKDASAPVEKRVDDLLSRMTLHEKVMQLNQYTFGKNTNINNIGETVGNIPPEIGSLIYTGTDNAVRNAMQKKAVEETRLGIPILFGHDVIHGFRTVYPIPLAQGCSWNPDLVEEACAMAAKESRMSGVEWTFSPMIDVARDPRWGRVAEGYGEDPYANGVFGAAAVKGYQGDDMSAGDKVAACLKHYVGYGASEAGRDYVYSEISGHSLWNTYLPPYEMGVRAGAATLMSSFNDISGMPGTANHYTLTEILKEKWGHDGFVVSDWNAVMQLENQGLAADGKEAARLAFNAGVEMDMVDGYYEKHLEELVSEGKVKMSLIDESVRRILRIKFRLGLFENPYVPEYTESERFLLPESMETAARMAEESMVLLKNNGILPLETQKKIAVVGPLAKNGADLLGSWCAYGRAEDVHQLYDGMVEEFSDKATVRFAEGCKTDGTDRSGFASALNLVRQSDVVVVCLGEKRGWSGENASRSSISLPEIQEELVKEMKKAGKPVVVVLVNGRPLELSRIEPLADAILEIWQPGVNGARPMAGILSGRINPSGKLCITFPYSNGQIPIYYNRHKRARGGDQGLYQDITSEPLYWFGHGLSYTSFEYGEAKASASAVKRGEKLSVEVPVTNTGSRDGMETVHWYVSDPYCTVATRPVKELKYFEKQLIKAGETRIFRFDVDLERDFGFYDNEGNRFLEAGEYHILVGDKDIKVELE